MKMNVVLALLLACICARASQFHQNQCDPEAIAVAVEHQIKEMKFAPDQLVCLSLPNYQDLKSTTLKKINDHGLQLLSGSSCWKPPRGFLLLILECERTGKEEIALRLEVDDMNLNGNHVTSRLREATYKLRLDGGQWKIGTYQVRSYSIGQKSQE